VAEVVEPDRVSELGGRGGGPDVVAEPAAGEVPVGVDDPGASGVVFAGRASVGSVGRERGLAVRAATLAEGVGGEGAVRVGPASVVWFGTPGRRGRLRCFARGGRVGRGVAGVGVQEGEGEQQVGTVQFVVRDVVA
jgi:hypothetical protein